ncbi:sorbosone dehydrogenase family protein [Methylotenera sp.]|uniref:PQQ-dependent sugar dehydrogenase n=1 Tax=Methylotenera sp. TaxID=2051956 RepID=UPI0027315EB3|nr:PQQ-dependent sugar dehydrogenase [Methylotenera sp.]MDP2231164.1 PQQ-dependent sugar dehydrogenase [Methylotenera sp.]MDP3140515.1 PQQ-dependent sugar dehydrogenase [Methylotenera sp.]
MVLENKMQKLLRFTIFTLLVSLAIFNIQTANAKPDLSGIKLPAGFKISIYADSKTKQGNYLAGARFMAFDASGNLYVSSAEGDRVVMLPDSNKDGVADEVVLVAGNLNAPQGLAFVGDVLLIANQDGVVKLEKDADNISNGGWSANAKPFISDLPSGGHTLKNIKLGPDGYLYLNIGSSCNVCVESDPRRATILRYTLDGKPAGALVTLGSHQQSAVWARGLRNSQGFAWHPKTGDMFATNNGADMRSDTKNGAVNDELPPEHLNKIEAAKHYGWPYCWGDPNNLKAQVEDPNFTAEPGFCKTTQAPAITFKAHATPIGITFLEKTNWSADYKQDAIVAMHGSWNRKQPYGYKLVRIKFKNNQPVEVKDFATGWLQDGAVWGRPVDVTVGTDHALYVSDDKAGAIYRITYMPGAK